MRALPSILLFFCTWTAVAQVDEKPPVIRRAPSSPIDDPSPSGKSGKGAKKETDNTTASGIVRRIDDKKIEVAIDDGRIFTAAIDSKTAFIGPEGKLNPDTVVRGTRVRISVKANDELDLTATSIVVEKLPPEAVAAAKPEDDATIMRKEDSDPDRPVLKRGAPQRTAKKAAADDEDDAKEEAEVKAPVPLAPKAAAQRESHPEDSNSQPVDKDASLASALTSDNQTELLKKARDANQEFIAHLPNFVCQQYTTRYERESKIEGWKAKDIISARVVYESRKEHYDNIKINNRTANVDMMAIKGARSTGEFGSFLEGLFAVEVNAQFRYLHAESFRQAHTKVFAYTVKRETTDWTISDGGQSIEPAYSGRVWINTETGRVMRIERQADDIPEAFPLNLTEQTVDYDMVMLGGRKVLLPVESSNLACVRGSSFCSKNVIQFRDYKEFRGDATITFDK